MCVCITITTKEKKINYKKKQEKSTKSQIDCTPFYNNLHNSDYWLFARLSEPALWHTTRFSLLVDDDTQLNSSFSMRSMNYFVRVESTVGMLSLCVWLACVCVFGFVLRSGKTVASAYVIFEKKNRLFLLRKNSTKKNSLSVAQATKRIVSNYCDYTQKFRRVFLSFYGRFYAKTCLIFCPFIGCNSKLPNYFRLFSLILIKLFINFFVCYFICWNLSRFILSRTYGYFELVAFTRLLFFFLLFFELLLLFKKKFSLLF